MKTIGFLLTVVLFLCLSQVNAQDNVQGMIREGILMANALTERNIELLRAEFDVLKAGDNTRSSYRFLYAGQTYAIQAFGDMAIKDVDVVLYTSSGGNWVEVARDNTSASTATVSVAPEVTALYRIDVIAYSFNPGFSYGNYGLFVASRTNGTSKLISDVMLNSLAHLDNMDDSGYSLVRAEFDIVNETTLTTKSMWRNLLGGVTYYALAYGGSGIQDISLCIYRREGSDWILQDKQDPLEPIAVALTTPLDDGFYRFDVGASFKEGYSGDIYGLFLFLKQ